MSVAAPLVRPFEAFPCTTSDSPTPSFTISSDHSSLESQFCVSRSEQSSLNSPSAESQSSSSSTESDLEKVWLNILDTPPGPLSVLELTEDDDVLCFDEKLNRIVWINAKTDEKTLFTVHKKFGIEHYYWSHIVAISNHVLLALLKKHSTKHFYLVSFKLKPDFQSADEMTVLNTRISCEGFQTTCQKINGNFFFGFFNTVKRYKIKARKSDSDVELLEKQFIEKDPSRSSLDSQKETANVKVDEELLNLDAQHSAETDKGFIRKAGSVIIKAHCDVKGQINFHVVSIGKKHLGFHVVLPKYDFTAIFTKSSKYGLQPKYMTKMPTPSLRGPFYHNRLTYFIDRENPLRGYMSKTFMDPKQDVISTLKSKLLTSTVETKRLEEISICSDEDGGPDADNVWSSFQVEANNGRGYVCVQDQKQDQLCFLWKLEIVNSIEEASNGAHEKSTVHAAGSLKSGSTGRAQSSLARSVSQATACSGGNQVRRAPVLKWSRLKCLEFESTFKLCENVALKVSKNCGFVRGIKSGPAEKENGYCVARFLL